MTAPNTLLQPEDLTRYPHWYPEALDLGAREIRFCHMDAASYRASPFLDQRIVRADEVRGVLPFTRLHDATLALPATPATHYVFHTAFCCSTHLTRLLDALDRALILREPDALYQVATFRRFRGTPLLLPHTQDEWDDLYRLVTGLLARRITPDVSVIVKPTDGCNNLMSLLLGEHADNRALFLTSSLPRFLAAVLKLPQRHEWARIRARELSLDVQHATGRLEVNPQGLDAAQTAALVWMLQRDACRATCAATGARLATLEDTRLLERPAEALGALLVHLGLACTQADIAAALAKADNAAHSKAPELRYDSQSRERDFIAARSRHEAEIAETLRWAEATFGTERVHAALPQPLL
jgi:hypothetical protein